MNWEKIAKTYAPGQTVKAMIEKVEHYGVFVRLAEGAPGYVKRSEALNTERVVDLTTCFSPGEEHEAVIVALNAKYGNLDLSFKSVLPNPLIDFCKRHKTSNVVEGEVVQVTDNYALVEIEEGVTGFLPREELWVRAQHVQDVLMIEDRVRCMMLSLEENKRPLLSIRALFREERDNSDKQSTYTLEDSISESFRISQWELKKQTEYEYQPSEEIIQAFHKVLLVDSSDTVIKPLSLLLESYGFQTRMLLIRDNTGFTADDENLFILSIPAAIHDTVRQLLQSNDLSERTIVVGTKEQFFSREKELQKLNCQYRITVPISPAAIFNVMQAMSVGSPCHQDAQDTDASSTENRLFHPEELKVIGSESALDYTMKSVFENSNATCVILFRMNLNSRETEIHSFYGKEPQWDEKWKTFLQFSPLNDVVLKSDFVSDDVGAHKIPHFKKLGNFKSFIGQRIHYRDEYGYALFLFGDKEYQFLDLTRSMLGMFELALRSQLQWQQFNQQRTEEQKFVLSGRLSAGLMHEMKNQLSAIKCYLDILKKDSISLNRGAIKSNDKAFLARFEESVDGALEMERQTRNIEDLFLNFFRQRKPEQTDLTKYLKGTIEALTPYAEYHDISVTTDLKKTPKMEIDKTALNQIIINLFMNSVDFVPSVRKTTGEIKISVDASEKGASVARVHFWDNGPGIHERHKERIFDLFFSTKRAGSGLGLYIAKECARILGGELYLAHSIRLSEIQFTLELPIMRGE